MTVFTLMHHLLTKICNRIYKLLYSLIKTSLMPFRVPNQAPTFMDQTLMS